MAIAQVAANFKNAPFLGQLLDILNHPTSAQRPDLHHFRPAGGDGGVSGGPGGPGRGVGGGQGISPARLLGSAPLAAAVVVAVLATLLAMAAALLASSAQARRGLRRLVLAAWHLHPSVRRMSLGLHGLLARLRLRRRFHLHLPDLGIPRLAIRRHSHRGLAAASLIAALPAVMVATVLASAEASRGAATLARTGGAPAGGHLRSEVAVDLVVPVGAPSAPPTWTRLVTIERGLVAQQDELAAQEGAIARLAVNVAGQQPDEDDGVVVGHDSPPQLRNRLSQLIAAHTATQTAFQRSLQAEYELYRAAAQDPRQRDQLTTAVAAHQPQAKEAVTYNLSLIQTQMAQEAVIAQAEGQLQQLGSLGAAQLDAMRHHQPFIAPMIAPVTQVFGPTDFSLEPPLSFNGAFYPHFHTGLDLGAPLDTPIHAAADGVVLLAAASVDDKGKLVGYGNYVVIAHPDGFVTLYGHLDSIAVKAGQVVHQGEIVGREGSTGWSTGPHVHFEVRHNGQFLDPVPFLAGQLPAS
jgi:murein DD-endopeptidase MepM/ murein hydrolase activator NlpD